MNPEKINAGVAAALSFVFNGLGQLYNGQILKGLVIIFLSAVSLIILALGSVLMGLWMLNKITGLNNLILGAVLFLIGLIFICILGIYSIVDTYKVGGKS